MNISQFTYSIVARHLTSFQFGAIINSYGHSSTSCGKQMVHISHADIPRSGVSGSLRVVFVKSGAV